MFYNYAITQTSVLRRSVYEWMDLYVGRYTDMVRDRQIGEWI
jgi:hypothetical protein